MIVKYFGHSSFEILTEKARLLFDPYYYAHAPQLIRLLEMQKPHEIYDYIFISHEHFDHCDSQLIHELMSHKTHIITTPEASEKLHHPCITLNEGQSYEDDKIKVTAVHAEHPQSVNPIGFYLHLPEEVYFAGDTYFFNALGHLGVPYVVFLPTGGTYTMTSSDAATAASIMRPTHMFPMHYDTWDPIKIDSQSLKDKVKEKTMGVKLHMLKPGEQTEV